MQEIRPEGITTLSTTGLKKTGRAPEAIALHRKAVELVEEYRQWSEDVSFIEFNFNLGEMSA